MSGRTTFPIESIFLSKLIDYNKIIDNGFEIVKKIIDTEDITKKGAHDILFFITSSSEAYDLCKRLYGIDDKYGRVFCVEVYSGMDSKKQILAQDKELYKKKDNYDIKLVFATNVAESSLTIDGIKYVVDTGYELRSSYDPEIRAKLLDRKLITQAQAKQRMGRAGRTEPGICYHMYTQNEFENEMEKFPQPDIRVSDLTGPSLKLLSLESIDGVKDLIKVYSEFIEPPQERYIKSAVMQLTQLGALEMDGITKLGKLMAELNLDPMPGIALIFSRLYKCSNEIVEIISMMDTIKMNMSNLFTTPTALLKGKDDDTSALKYLEDKYKKARSKLKHKYGDHHSLLLIYNKFKKMYEKNKDNYAKMNEWTYSRFLKLDPLLKVMKYSKKIKRNLIKVIPKDLKAEDLNLEFNESIVKMDVDDRILACLIIGYRTNMATRKGKSEYRTIYAKDLKIKINKNSFLHLGKMLPKNIIYSELFISMGKSDLNIVSKTPQKLLEIFVNF